MFLNHRIFILLFSFWLCLTTALPQVSNPVNRAAVLDFDGDGKTDIAVVRFDTDEIGRFRWYIRSSQTGQMLPVVQFGSANALRDELVPADYDGDGKTDIAVFRKGSLGNIYSPTNFYIWQSSTNSLLIARWGIGRDNPFITQDFDGDGKADPTVVRCFDANGILPAMTWYILQSSTNYQTYRIETFGTCSEQYQDRPIRGDFDGDRKADVAFYRKFDINANGQPTPANRFYIKLSSKRNIIRKVNFGDAESGILDADFDGDGRTDLALTKLEGVGEIKYRWWYWVRSADGVLETRQFGYRESGPDVFDFPAVGDYDGDGKTDVAVYRDSGLLDNKLHFYIQGSRDGFMAVQWGRRLTDLVPANSLFAY